MTSPRPTLVARLERFFGVDDPWERPRPPIDRRDGLLALGFAAVGLLALELVRSVGALDKVTAPLWVQWLAVTSGAVLLIGRRRWPLTVAALAAAHMLLVGITLPEIMGQFPLQVAYFVAFLSGVSWARDRRAMLLLMGAIVLVMFAWVGLQFAVGSAVQEFLDAQSLSERSGAIGALPAAVLLSVMVNAIYFGGAIVGGQASWRTARQQALLSAQAATIEAQSENLRTQAITDERVRIARELHDVVAHHVSVIGVQAGAARRVLDTDPDAARGALENVEQSAREAVTSMRRLLGTLRGLSPGPNATDRSPEPTALDLSTLVAEASTPQCAVELRVTEDVPGAVAALPAPVAHALHRITQEALTNVRTHSTARAATVSVRVSSGERAYAEVEVVDDGRTRPGTSGSGLGHLGIRERVGSHGGSVEIGPRAVGGYRVRARIPLESSLARADAPGVPAEAGS